MESSFVAQSPAVWNAAMKWRSLTDTAHISNNKTYSFVESPFRGPQRSQIAWDTVLQHNENYEIDPQLTEQVKEVNQEVSQMRESFDNMKNEMCEITQSFTVNFF